LGGGSSNLNSIIVGWKEEETKRGYGEATKREQKKKKGAPRFGVRFLGRVWKMFLRWKCATTTTQDSVGGGQNGLTRERQTGRGCESPSLGKSGGGGELRAIGHPKTGRRSWEKKGRQGPTRGGCLGTGGEDWDLNKKEAGGHEGD